MGKALRKHRTMENYVTGPNGLIKFPVSKNWFTLLGNCRHFLQCKEKSRVGAHI